VIAYDTWMSEEALEGKLAPLGIPVARFCCYRLNTLGAEIPRLGRIVGREEAAAEYLHYFQKCLQETKERLKGLGKRVRLYAEGYSRFVTYSKKGPAAQVLECAGVENLAAHLPVPAPRITAEWVVAENPQVIIKVTTATYVKMGFGSEDLRAVVDFRKELLQRPVWDQIDAIKTGRVHLISGEIWSGPRAAVGLLYLAKWCYPDRFQDLDPEQVHRQWLRKWHQKELKGIYVYP
jgi:iron complex transport system substrate-binding protein